MSGNQGYRPLYGPGSTPRTLPASDYRFHRHDPNRSETFSNFQSSSSQRGRVTNRDENCVRAYIYYECGCVKERLERTRACWKCNDLDHGLCTPENVEIDRDGDCPDCREALRKAREERARREARDRARERSPYPDGSSYRSRSY